jgi:glycerophosphoryl diester phosphodiesterase
VGGEALSRKTIVIAHRGASGYLPEHTLASYAVAILQGADYIEPDLVITRDGRLIARHDNLLDPTTDVGSRPEFAARRTGKLVDGTAATGWFSEDFTLEEIKRVRALERIPDLRPANSRFDGQFEVPTLQEVIDLVKAMERVTGRAIGIYPETKHPTYFERIGLPLEERLVGILHANGYAGRQARVFIQSFEVGNLRRLRALTDLPLVQLLGRDGRPYDMEAAGGAGGYQQMATARGLAEIAAYADGVGPDKRLVIPLDADGNLDAGRTTAFVADAHVVGLQVHPYTFRAENVFLPGSLRRGAGAPSDLGDLPRELDAFLGAGIDGFFVDQPDIGVGARDRFVAGSF